MTIVAHAARHELKICTTFSPYKGKIMHNAFGMFLMQQEFNFCVLGFNLGR
jgi:hypothetical protein